MIIILNFYDFEVFRYDWLVVIGNPVEGTTSVFINDVPGLTKYYEAHKNQIWIGYNVNHYDQYILKGIILGMDPWKINEHIIAENKPGWSYSKEFKKIPLINYDISILGKSLKELEGFQGHNIHESGVDFRIMRELTAAEIAETVQYCTNDVEEAMNVWLEKKSDFDAQMELIKMFELPLSSMNRTKAQITADILGCVKKERFDEWELFALPCVRVNKYKKVLDWFMDSSNYNYNKPKLKIDIAGVPHVFAWGGVHGAKEKYHHKCKRGKDIILHVDVQSYYPSIMIFWNLLSRNATKPHLYKEVYEMRLALKAQGKKKEQAPLKIVLNATYGICNDKNSNAYDPRNAHLITMNGQLMLLDLIEKLEAIPSFELIQSNTDGLIIKIAEKDFDLCDDICYEWEQRTRMGLSFDYIEEIWQKDVNNYIFRDEDGKLEKKGAYVKGLSSIDNDLPIINKALVDYMTKGISPETTINSCNDLIMFQKVSKLTGNYDKVEHNGKLHNNKCYRIFASKSPMDRALYKMKGNKKDKFSNTSERSFLENGNIEGAPVPDKLDREWYINLARERLEQFGLTEFRRQYSLF